MIVCADLAGAELRVAALLAKDEPFLSKFRAGQSPHLETAKALFQREVSKSEPAYTFSKAFTFRWIFTIPGEGISDEGGQLRLYTVGLDAAALQPMIARMDQAHPAMVRWKLATIRELERTGKVHCPWSSYRNLSWAIRSWDKGLQTTAKRRALNYPIQRSITWIINRAVIAITDSTRHWPEGEGLILNEHDSLSLYCSEQRVEEGCRLLKEAMEQPVPELGGERMVAEVKCGSTWGSVKPVEVV